MAREVCVTTNCKESDLNQQIDFNSPKSLATASAASANGDGEDEKQACSNSTPAAQAEDSAETYYLPYQPKTEGSTLSPYQSQDGSNNDVWLSKSFDQLPESSLPQERYTEVSSIRLVLEDADLWKKFDALGNEMIITKAGR